MQKFLKSMDSLFIIHICMNFLKTLAHACISNFLIKICLSFNCVFHELLNYTHIRTTESSHTYCIFFWDNTIPSDVVFYYLCSWHMKALQIPVSINLCIVKTLGPFSTAFLSGLAGSYIGSEAAETLTSVHNLLHHDGSHTIYFLTLFILTEILYPLTNFSPPLRSW